MRVIEAQTITQAVKTLCMEANYYIPKDVQHCIARSIRDERSERATNTMEKIMENIEISRAEGVPLCQDTGVACVFVEVGQEVRIVGGLLADAINAGVAQGYDEGYLRKSVVSDPLHRINTQTNTPAMITTDLVLGDKIKIVVAPKGFGSENMSRLKMCAPSEGVEGVSAFVVETVTLADANPCPPIVVGVGIGGTFDKVALLAKRALLRPLDIAHANPFYRDLEQELLQKINQLGIGPQGFGGDTTALKVQIETAPTHIAGLPVAVNINCHVTRHKEVIL